MRRSQGGIPSPDCPLPQWLSVSFERLILNMIYGSKLKQESFSRYATAKCATFGAPGIAFGVSYGLTGSVAISGAITVLEPLVNTVARYFFDRWWGVPDQKALWARHKASALRATAA
jgi:uncharacterized membrane protein